MSVLLETSNLRLFSPTEVFGGRFRHPCHNNCGHVMVVPDPTTPSARNKLEDGNIWVCIKCWAKHEYYLAYTNGSRSACVRLLVGTDQRQAGEPTVGEFVPGAPVMPIRRRANGK